MRIIFLAFLTIVYSNSTTLRAQESSLSQVEQDAWQDIGDFKEKWQKSQTKNWSAKPLFWGDPNNSVKIPLEQEEWQRLIAKTLSLPPTIISNGDGQKPIARTEEYVLSNNAPISQRSCPQGMERRNQFRILINHPKSAKDLALLQSQTSTPLAQTEIIVGCLDAKGAPAGDGLTVSVRIEDRTITSATVYADSLHIHASVVFLQQDGRADLNSWDMPKLGRILYETLQSFLKTEVVPVS